MTASQGRAAEILAVPVRTAGAMFVPAAVPAAPAANEKYLLLAVLLLAAVLRFWELGSFSLHKSDEDTTVLAAAHILEDGTPRFPSGMFYGRAIVQSYLIGASFKVFGASEWSARLPSVLCGILAVLLGWLAARRFLEFPWRIGFALCLALLPAMIADSQEARMYGFMVACLIGATWQVFRWDADQAGRHLLFAIIWFLVAIQFQYLAVLGAGVLLFPGLSRGSLQRTLQGIGALFVVGLGYLLISEWQGGFYPELARQQYFPQWTDPLTAGPKLAVAGLPLAAAGAAAVFCGAVALLATRRVAGTLRWGIVILVLAAILQQGLQQYHLAALCWLAAAVLAWPRREIDWRFMVLLMLAAVGLAVAQLIQATEGQTSLRQAAGAMLGWPSVWPLVQLARYSWVAAAVVAIGAIAALVKLAQARAIHPVWLYFALTVWVPLLVVGTQAWFVPPRYVQFAMVPMLLTAFVVAASWRPARRWVMAVPAALLIANPVASWEAVAVGNRSADHRAAAQFLKDLPLREDDIIIAEEAMMQTYYLGRVDYWLASPQVAGQFVVLRDGRFLNQYTHSPFVDSVAALERVIAEAGPRRVFIIGTAERGDRTYFRGEALHDYLQSGSLETIYEGPTGNRIWRAGGAP
jgi:hypothetical protein